MDRVASSRRYMENLTQIRIFTETKNLSFNRKKRNEQLVPNLQLKSIDIYYIDTLGIRRSGRMILLWYR